MPIAIALLLLCSALAAQDTSAASELKQMLNTFLEGAARNDFAVHDRFWADDLIYTGSTGRRVGKPDILKSVREAGPAKAGELASVYSAEDIRIQQYGSTAVIAFKLVATNTKDGSRQQYLNTGTFVNRSGEWRVVAWQATKLEGPKP